MQLVEEKKILDIVVNRLVDSSYKKIKSLISFLQLSSLFTAISAFFRTYYSFLLFGAMIKWDLLLATALSVFAVYCLNNLIDADDDEINSPKKASFVKKNKKIIGFVVAFSYSAAIILGILENIFAVLILLFPLLAGTIYSIQISPKIPRLKDILGVKSLTVASSWAVVSTFLPLINSNNIPMMFIPLLFYFFFMKSFVISVLLDVRDIKGDKENGINTIPVIIGKAKAKKLLLLIASSFMPIIFLLLIYGLYFGYFITLAFSMVITYFNINYICNNKEIYGPTVQLLVHGEWLFVLVLFFIVNMI